MNLGHFRETVDGFGVDLVVLAALSGRFVGDNLGAGDGLEFGRDRNSCSRNFVFKRSEVVKIFVLKNFVNKL